MGIVNFSDCEFIDNTAKKTTGYIYINKGGNVNFERVRFENKMNKYI